VSLSLRLAGLRARAGISEDRVASLEEQLERKVQALAASPPGFIRILFDDAALSKILDTASQLPDTPHWVILGIGGSALGARAVRDTLIPDRRQDLRILDNIDPDSMARAADQLDLEKTRFLVISKSGSTAETAAQLLFFHDRLLARGLDPWQHIVAITDPESGLLREVVGREGIPSFEVPSDVGGRFSVLTAVGLAPARLLGLDSTALIVGAQQMWESVRDGGRDHPLLRWVAEAHLRSIDHGQRCQVMMVYCDRLRTFGGWFAQLWAESLGKREDRNGVEVHHGSTPLVAVGSTDQHSLVQLFAEGPDDKQYLIVSAGRKADVALQTGSEGVHDDLGYLLDHTFGELFDAQREGTTGALRAAGRPVSELNFGELDEAHLGASFLFFQLATVLAAELLEVDPFDQPGVEAGKILAFSRMGRSDAVEEAGKILAGAVDPEPAVELPPLGD